MGMGPRHSALAGLGMLLLVTAIAGCMLYYGALALFMLWTFVLTGGTSAREVSFRMVAQVVTLPVCCVFVAYLAAGLFSRWQSAGVRLDRADHPDLFQAVGTLAHRFGISPPDAIFVVPEASLSVYSGGALGRSGLRNVIIVGAPVLACLTAEEQQALLVHELAHLALRRSSWQCSLLNKVEHVWERAISAHKRAWFVSRHRGLTHHRHPRLTHP